MEVYIEEVLLNNFIITTLLLFFSGKLTSIKTGKRIILGGILGAITTILFPLINLSTILLTILKMFLGILIVLVSFSKLRLKTFLFVFITFLGLTALFGGVVIAINYCFPSTYLPLGLITLIIIFISYLLMLWIKNLYKKKAYNNFVFKIEISVGENCYETSAYLDTGNTLVDPETQKPVIVIGPKCLKKLYSNVELTDILLGKISVLNDARYIKIGTAITGGKMLIFRLDKVKILDNGTEIADIYAGLSYSNFNKNFNCEILLNPMIF